MPTVEAQIWLALKSRIDTLVTNPMMTKYEPGSDIDPPSDANGPAPFILIGDARNESDRITIGKQSDGRVKHIHSGTLILSIQWPVARPVTHTQLVQIGGAVAEHFPADTRMKYENTCLRVTKDADSMQPDRDGAYFSVFVRVPWTTL